MSLGRHYGVVGTSSLALRAAEPVAAINAPVLVDIALAPAAIPQTGGPTNPNILHHLPR